MPISSEPSAAGRVVCARCGANNFQTQAACWKCGTALTATPSVPNGSPLAHAPFAPPFAAATPLPVDPVVATASAIALAALFPYIALPVGIVFLMLEDRRKLEIGKITIVAGLIFTIAHSLFFAWLTKAAWDQVRGFLPRASGVAARIQQQRQPGMTEELPPGFPTP
ncbi:MAG: hypothetical protein H7Z41_18325 [Cytophagales bacterium]|nr:hypothetical protein [Armatimonadota bacterium]